MTFSNPYFTVILAAVIFLWLLDVVAGWLNVKHFSPQLPAEFTGTYEPEKYATSQLYNREGERFELISSSVQLVAFLAFWLGGGFRWLDALVTGWLPDSPVQQGLAGISLLYAGAQLISLPFSWYDTFVIEEKYGFNKMTKGTFVMDQIKSLALGAGIGLPILALVIWMFGRFTDAWFWVWVTVTVIMLALQFVAPRWLMPIFNKFSPFPEGELKQKILALGEKCGFPVSELFIIDGSKRSTKANAFFAGFGRNKRIALFDTLIEKHPEPELLAVLAHEIGHFRRGHIIQRMIAGVLQMAVIFFLMGLFLKNGQLSAAFGVSEPKIWLSLVFFTFLFEPIQSLIGLIMNRWSRKHEFEADAFAAEHAGSGPMISGLKRLASDTLSNLTPHPLTVVLNYSHPPMLERIAALRNMRQAE